MNIEDHDLWVLANRLSKQCMGHHWRPHDDSVVNRVIAGIIELERAGMDWIEAVKSDRFIDGYESVGRILVYPKDRPCGSEPFKLVDMLGLDHSDGEDRYSLTCYISIHNWPRDETVRTVWNVAADIAVDIITGMRHEPAVA